MNIGERIRIARGNLSQAQFAARLGIHPKTVAKYESGKHGVGGAVLEAICLAFPEIDPAWLLTGQARTASCAEAPRPPASAYADKALMGMLTEGLAAIHEKRSIPLSPGDLGKLAARLHNEIAAAADTPDDYPGAVKLRLAQYRGELAAGRTPDAPSKN